jgi:hypothetical protein
MAKKKKNSGKAAPAQVTPQSARTPSPAPKTTPATAAPTRNRWPMLLVAVLGPLLLLGAGAVWLLSRPSAPAAPALAATAAVFSGRVGSVDGCRIQPPFTTKLGFSRSTMLSTAERTLKGLVLVEPAQDNSAAPRTYQDPSWTLAGYLGPNTFDARGNLYVAPSPRVSLNENPPERQNTIYKVDGETGKMTAWITLPVAAPITLNNPYGVMGLAYDCETDSVYATSVAGSTRSEMLGRVFQINATRGEIVSQLDNLDGMGVSVFNTSQGKRLFAGSARTQDVLSVALTPQGQFAGAPQVEFSLEGLGPDGNDKARKIAFDKANTMLVNGTKFNYNLAPPAAQIRPMTYRFRYDAGTGRWTFVDVSAGTGSLGN